MEKLAQHVDLLTGFPFKSKFYTEDSGGIRLVRGDNVVQGRLRWENVKRWPQSMLDDLGSYELHDGDVVLAMDRPWIEAGLKYARITEHDTPSLLVQRVARLRAKPELDQRFLFYLIGSSAFTAHVLAVQTGTAVPHISGRQIGEFDFRLPPLAEQRAIAGVLGALDDKIEQNRRTARVLERLARAIFRAWFIDFAPVKAKAVGATAFPSMPQVIFDTLPTEFEDSELGPIPQGWEVKAIGDAVTAKGGGTPSTKEPKYWDGGTHHWATPKDMSKLEHPILADTDRKITDAGVDKISSGLLPPGTVLMSSRAPVGYLAINAVPTAINQGFIAMVCDGPLPASFVLFWAMTSMDQIKARAAGTTFAEISKKNFRPIPVVVPPSTVCNAFDEATSPMLKSIEASIHESRKLAELRDYLLPKLLSGQVRVRAGGSEGAYEPPSFDELREVEPHDWPGRSLVEQDNMGDWGGWLDRYDGALQDAFLDPTDDCTGLAEMMADDYIAACDEADIPLPRDFADDRESAFEDDRAAIRAEFLAFLQAWKRAWKDAERDVQEVA